MKFFSSTQDLLLYNHTVLPKPLSFIPFSVSHLGLKVYTLPSLGFAGGRLVILFYSRRFTIFVRGRTARDTCSAVAICSSFKSSFAIALPA